MFTADKSPRQAIIIHYPIDGDGKNLSMGLSLTPSTSSHRLEHQNYFTQLGYSFKFQIPHELQRFFHNLTGFIMQAPSALLYSNQQALNIAFNICPRCIFVFVRVASREANQRAILKHGVTSTIHQRLAVSMSEHHP